MTTFAYIAVPILPRGSRVLRLIFTVLQVGLCLRNASGQESLHVPGSCDFMSRALQVGLIPLPSSGVDGVLRNPANFGMGFSCSKIYFNSQIINYLGMEYPSGNALTFGWTFESRMNGLLGGLHSLSNYHIGLTLGITGAKGQLPNLDVGSTGTTSLLLGVSWGYTAGESLNINIGTLYHLIYNWHDDRVDNSIDATIYNLLTLSIVRRDVIGGLDAAPYSRSSSVISYQIARRYRDFTPGLFAKLYSNPVGEASYYPTIFIRYAPASIGNPEENELYSKYLDQHTSPMLYIDLYYNVRGNWGIEFNLFDFLTIAYVQDSFGPNWKITWIGFFTKRPK